MDRHAVLDLHPLLATIDGGEGHQFRAHKQQVAIHVILRDRPHVMLWREGCR